MLSPLQAEKQRLLLSTARLSQTLERKDLDAKDLHDLKERYDIEVERISQINQELAD